jgi:hypothetical protein
MLRGGQRLKPKLTGDPEERSGRICAEFSHDMSAVGLDCAMADPEQRADCPVVHAAKKRAQNISLSL